MELTKGQKARIEAGAALLDSVKPNWFSALRHRELDINSFSNCVLCHVFSNYWDGLEFLGIRDPEDARAAEYGFYPHSEDESYMEDIEVWDTDSLHRAARELAEAKTQYWIEVANRRMLESIK